MRVPYNAPPFEHMFQEATSSTRADGKHDGENAESRVSGVMLK